MNTNKTSFVHCSKEEMKEAYRWASREMERLRCNADPVVLKLKSDCLDHDKDGCIISIFMGEEGILFRRDWLSVAAVQYNSLTNIDELIEVAPRSVLHMIENGVKMYHYFEGDHGGVTRDMRKTFLLRN